MSFPSSVLVLLLVFAITDGKQQVIVDVSIIIIIIIIVLYTDCLLWMIFLFFCVGFTGMFIVYLTYMYNNTTL